MTRVARALVVPSALAAAALLPASAAALSLAVKTESAKDVAATTATLRAKVTVPPLGAAVGFQYGPTTAYGTTSAWAPTSVLSDDVKVVVGVADLQPSTTYHVRAVAASGWLLAYGRDMTFTTGAAGTGPVADADDGSTSGSDSSGSDASGSDASGSGSSGTSGSGSGSSGTSSSGADGAAHDSTPTTTSDDDPPAPTLGRSIAAETVRGSVTATSPSGAPVDLAAAAALPSGTVIDTRKGTVELTSAIDRKGTTQTGRFWGALFEVRQSATGKGMTQLVLRGGDFSGCRARAAGHGGIVAHAAASAKPPRRLWGSDRHGRFQTRGRGSVATVRGTRWITEDRCEGTLTRVTEGAVAVYDLRRHRTQVVTHGHRYLARVAR
jgi:hypothetical protein